ncbi:hypothetical protein QQX09_00550 [Demequina sp. SYSU T00192]|uniref:Uncharacterized protein n=1 Tax=Demequina litoralis TaxID=3051660 RepID=A0ABT8G5C6_9MICO|nr:hypothetical protein [Demequina sp. SYSU T00192]MDN4474336.1 hypothetical protein [Demequina sp. SYSU T00192]
MPAVDTNPRTSAADSLARRRHLRLQPEPHARLLRLQCFSPQDDWTYRVTLPSPAVLANAWVLPDFRDRGLEILFRPGVTGLYVRRIGSDEVPQPLDLQATVTAQRERLAALPEDRPGGTHEPYRGARMAALYGDRTAVEDYLLAAVKATRSGAKPWTPPEDRPPAQARPPAFAPAARQRIHRAGLADRRTATSAQWLATHLRDRFDTEEGPEFMPTSTLWSEALSTVEDLDDDPEFAAFAMPGRNGFLKVVDAILGGRQRRATGAGYSLPAGNELLHLVSDAEDHADDAADRAIAATQAAREAERQRLATGAGTPGRSEPPGR